MTRPELWPEDRPAPLLWSITTLLEKRFGAAGLSQYRPISLLSHLQKIVLKSIRNCARWLLDKMIGSHQTGFRVAITWRVVELRREWAQYGGLSIVKLDLAKAFDKFYHLAILRRLWNWPRVHGAVSENEAQPERGVRQGSREAGAVFLLGVEESMGPLVDFLVGPEWASFLSSLC